MSWGFSSKAFNLDALSTARSALSASLNVVEEARSRIDKALDIEGTDGNNKSKSSSQVLDDSTSKKIILDSDDERGDKDPGDPRSEAPKSIQITQPTSKSNLSLKQENTSKIIKENTQNIKKLQEESTNFNSEQAFDETLSTLDVSQTKQILSGDVSEEPTKSLAGYYGENLTGSLLSNLWSGKRGNATTTMTQKLEPLEENIKPSRARTRINSNSNERCKSSDQDFSSRTLSNDNRRTISSEDQPLFTKETNLIKNYITGLIEDEEQDLIQENDVKIAELEKSNERLRLEEIEIRKKIEEMEIEEEAEIKCANGTDLPMSQMSGCDGDLEDLGAVPPLKLDLKKKESVPIVEIDEGETLEETQQKQNEEIREQAESSSDKNLKVQTIAPPTTTPTNGETNVPLPDRRGSTSQASRMENSEDEIKRRASLPMNTCINSKSGLEDEHQEESNGSSDIGMFLWFFVLF